MLLSDGGVTALLQVLAHRERRHIVYGLQVHRRHFHIGLCRLMLVLAHGAMRVGAYGEAMAGWRTGQGRDERPDAARVASGGRRCAGSDAAQ